MNEALARILLVVYVFIVPAVLLLLAHLLSRKFRRNFIPFAPVFTALVYAGFLLHDVLASGGDRGFMSKWSFYIHSDASIGMIVYAVSVTFSVLTAAVYTFVTVVQRRRSAKRLD